MRNKPHTISQVAIGAAAALIFSGCSAAGGGSAANNESLEAMEPITLTAAEVVPEGAAGGQAMKAFAEEIKENTNGKVEIEVYYSTSLMPGEEMLAGIGDGLADLGTLSASYFPQELPTVNFLNELSPFTNPSTSMGLLQGGAALKEMLTGNEEIQQEFSNHNVVPVTAGYLPRYGLFCTDSIETAEDAQGMLARTGGPLYASEASALGMEPVPIPVGDIYEGLQRGVIDCTVLTADNIVSLSLWEVADQYYQTNMSGFTGSSLVFNEEVWDSLPTDVQEIIQEAANTHWATWTSGVAELYTQFATEGPAEHGVVFGDPEPLDEILDEHHEKWLSEAPERAPSTLDDPEQFIAEFSELTNKWETILKDDFDINEAEKTPDAIREDFILMSEVDVEAVAQRLQEELDLN